MAKPNDIQFNLINPYVVDRLVKDGKIDLPHKKVDIPKDMRWNEKILNNAVLAGIQNGESVNKIAKRIFPEIMKKTDFSGKTQQQIYGKGGIIDKNRMSSIRNARTMVTSAENHGRLDSMKALAKQGAIIRKYWEATPDDRTRPSHMDIDGEEQELDRPFSNGCQFPGDGKGPPDEVWMCRCSMGDRFLGFRREDGTVSLINYKREKTLHDKQIAREKAKRATAVKNSMKKPAYEVKLGETGERYTQAERKELLQILTDNKSDSRNIYLKYVDELKASKQPPAGQNAFYRPNEDRVYLKPRVTAKGSSYEGKFGVHFHEYGHNIDYKAGGGNPISLAYRDDRGRTFEQIITQEWEKKFSEKTMWKSFESNLDLSRGGMGGKQWALSEVRDWAERNGYRYGNPMYDTVRHEVRALNTDDEVREYIKKHIDIFSSGNHNLSKNSKDVIEAFCKEIKDKYTLRERADISDMFERFSIEHGGPTYPFGIGHGASYAHKDGSLAKEAFAEMFSAEIANLESLKAIKEVLPESYKAFKEINRRVVIL